MKTYPDCFSVLLWHVSKERLLSGHTGAAGVHPETTWSIRASGFSCARFPQHHGTVGSFRFG